MSEILGFLVELAVVQFFIIGYRYLVRALYFVVVKIVVATVPLRAADLISTIAIVILTNYVMGAFP